MTARRKEDIEVLARQTLVDHGLLAIPVNPVTVAKKLGIRLSHAVFNEPKYSGLTARRGKELTVLIKEGDSPYRKRFTAAHEIGHCLLHLSDAVSEIIDTDADFFRCPPVTDVKWTAKQRREWEANVFAAELLMPRDLVSDYWRRIPEQGRTLETMARIFQVSEEAMGYRLSELDLLEDE